MEEHLGKIWVSGVVLVGAILVFVQGDSRATIRSRPGDAPLVVALTQLGILYIIAPFVERGLTVGTLVSLSGVRLPGPTTSLRASRTRANQTGPTRASG